MQVKEDLYCLQLPPPTPSPHTPSIQIAFTALHTLHSLPSGPGSPLFSAPLLFPSSSLQFLVPQPAFSQSTHQSISTTHEHRGLQLIPQDKGLLEPSWNSCLQDVCGCWSMVTRKHRSARQTVGSWSTGPGVQKCVSWPPGSQGLICPLGSSGILQFKYLSGSNSRTTWEVGSSKNYALDHGL